MLSIGKLTGGAHSARYYEQSVASGREDYYTGEGEAQGQWVGSGAQRLGLAGELERGELERLLGGEHPQTGADLRAGARGRRPTVQGFDLTFSAPKSVSVLYAAGDEHVRAAAVAAHEAAVRDALGYLEREALQVRRGRDGVLVEHASAGLVAGAFRHRSSRAGDPQLHTHVVAANLAKGADGRWTALYSRVLYRHAKTGGYLYQASLRHQLTQQLGVEWTPVRHGSAEIAGIPQGVLEHFSQRRAEILDAMHQRGAHSTEGARAAALATRRAKTYDVHPSTIYERWQARAAEHGLTRQILHDVVGRDVAETLDVDAAAALMTGEAGLTAHASTFTRREALQAWCAHHRHGASVADVERLADRWLASPLAVRLDGETPDPDHNPIAVRVARMEPRYSTPGMLQAERALLERAEQGRDARAGLATDTAVQAALAARPTIRDEQAAMVAQLTQGGQRIDAIRGLAGTGKTFALDACGEAWRASGLPVAGVTLSGKATDVLREQTGLHTMTIAQLFAEQERFGPVLGRGQILVVDEAGMVGTRALTRLADMIDAVDGKLVLVGDDHQLAEIDAGGAFRALVDRQHGVQLTHVTRQRDEQAIAELGALREGRADEALRSMHERGNLVIGSSAQETRELIVRDWLHGHSAAAQDGPAFMVAKRHADVADLNHRARQALLNRGQLGEDATMLGDREFRVGDRVIAGRNDRRLDVRNGTTGSLERIDRDERQLRIRTDRDTELSLPFNYAAARTDTGRRQLEHAYAVTVHRAQGDTWGRAYYLGGQDSYRQEAYTALSRPRHEGRFYATAPDLDERLGTAGDPLAELQPLLRALERDGRHHLALDALDAAAIHARPDAELQREAERLRALTRQPPAIAVLALQRIDHERATPQADLEAARSRLLQRREQLVHARRAERATAEQAVAGSERAVGAQIERVQALDAQRNAVLQRIGDPAVWLEHHSNDIRRLAAIEAELAGRASQRAELAVRVATIDPPEYITAVLGAPPVDPARRQIWTAAAQQIEHYRRSAGRGLEQETPGLGPEPHNPEARLAWQAHQRRIDDLTHHLAAPDRVRSGPELAPDR